MLKTSAKLGTGVDESFLEMTKTLIKKQNSMSAEDKKKLNPGSKLGGLGKYSKGSANEGGSKGCC